MVSKCLNRFVSLTIIATLSHHHGFLVLLTGRHEAILDMPKRHTNYCKRILCATHCRTIVCVAEVCRLLAVLVMVVSRANLNHPGSIWVNRSMSNVIPGLFPNRVPHLPCSNRTQICLVMPPIGIDTPQCKLQYLQEMVGWWDDHLIFLWTLDDF